MTEIRRNDDLKSLFLMPGPELISWNISALFVWNAFSPSGNTGGKGEALEDARHPPPPTPENTPVENARAGSREPNTKSSLCGGWWTSSGGGGRGAWGGATWGPVVGDDLTEGPHYSSSIHILLMYTSMMTIETS